MRRASFYTVSPFVPESGQTYMTLRNYGQLDLILTTPTHPLVPDDEHMLATVMGLRVS
jgi:hypothetical protein